MSFVDRLFPPGELEALGNKWEEPALKRRKVVPSPAPGPERPIHRRPSPSAVQDAAAAARAAVSKGPRRKSYESAVDPRRHRLAPTAHGHPHRMSMTTVAQLAAIQRSFADAHPTATRGSTTAATAAFNTPATGASTPFKSCLPSFIEPSILKNYLNYLHPHDRTRFNLPQPAAAAQTATRSPAPAQSKSPSQPQSQSQSPAPEDRQPSGKTAPDADDHASPASLVSDHSTASVASDHCPTPPVNGASSVVGLLRSGPFGELINGLRLTDQERDMMKDLLNVDGLLGLSGPGPGPGLGPAGPKYRTAVSPIDLFPPNSFAVTTDADRDEDVHSSGLSPAPTADEGADADAQTPAGIVMYDYGALNVDDFFDLDEAAEAISPIAPL